MTSTRSKAYLLPLHDHPHHIEATCQLLNNQWSRSPASRSLWLRQSIAKLPISYIYVQKNEFTGKEIVLGHARVAASMRIGGTMSVVSGIITSVIVHPEHRRQGHGKVILSLVEERCRNVHGFGRVVLWTNDQVDFYQSCGYIKCTPLRVVSAAASKLGMQGLNSLENMLKLRMRRPSTASSTSSAAILETKTQNTSLTPPSTIELSEEDTSDGGDASASTWLSKRVIDHFPTYKMKRNEVIADIQIQFERQAPEIAFKKVLVLLLDVPNEQQIGPCCGMAAMRCVRDYWKTKEPVADVLLGESISLCLSKNKNKNNNNNNNNKNSNNSSSSDSNTILHECQGKDNVKIQYHANASMLEIAIAKNWTIDGEMFNTIHLGELGANPCGMATRIYTKMSVELLVTLIGCNIPIMVPFDKASQNQEHVVAVDQGGKRAHWGIVRGVCGLPCNEEYSGVYWDDEDGLKKKERVDVKCFEEMNDVFVVLQHTTHGKVSVVPFAKLVVSNAHVDDCISSDDRGIGWIEKERHLASTWLVCWLQQQ